MSINIASVSPAVLVNPVVETAFSTASGARAIIQPSSGLFEQELVRLRAIFRVTGNTTTNFTPAIRCDTAANTNLTTFTGDTALTAISAAAVNSTTLQWIIVISLIFPRVNSQLFGRYAAQLDGSANTGFIAIAGSAVTGLRFFPTGLFSSSDAGNKVVLTEFSLDVD